MFTCPVCFYPEMPDSPQDYHICPCCGTEFGNDDQDLTYTQLRDRWVNAGTPWFFGRPPNRWDPQAQLERGSSAVEAGISLTSVKIVEFGGGSGSNTSAFVAVAGVVGFYTFQPQQPLVLHDSATVVRTLMFNDSAIERTMNPNALPTI